MLIDIEETINCSYFKLFVVDEQRTKPKDIDFAIINREKQQFNESEFVAVKAI